MEELRRKNPSLNFFTTERLVALSQDLARMKHKHAKSLTAPTLMMLRLIAFNLSDKELNKFALNNLNIEAHDISDQNIIANEEPEEEQEEEDPFAELKATLLFGELKNEYDFHETIALAAIINLLGASWRLGDKVGEDQISELTDWCMSADPDECDRILDDFKAAQKTKCQLKRAAPETPMEVSFDEDVNEEEENEEEQLQSIANIFAFDDRKGHQLSKKLEMVWKNFLNLVNQLKITDFINLKSVAKILQKLSMQHEPRPMRKMPKMLSVGQPNMIVCPEKEMFSMCLTIYSTDDGKPLPSLDEVLICTPSTSREQIELVIRRAFSDQKGKIFCLLHAENIDYESSVYVEKLISGSTVQNHSYQLVFITSKESHDKSYIATALDQYRRAMPDLSSQEPLKDYLFKQISASKQAADHDGCSSRLVVSNVAGQLNQFSISRNISLRCLFIFRKWQDLGGQKSIQFC